jgi:hypothetical protein
VWGVNTCENQGDVSSSSKCHKRHAGRSATTNGPTVIIGGSSKYEDHVPKK